MTYNVFTEQDHLDAMDVLDTFTAHSWFRGNRFNAWNEGRIAWQAFISELPAERAIDLAGRFLNGGAPT